MHSSPQWEKQRVRVIRGYGSKLVLQRPYYPIAWKYWSAVDFGAGRLILHTENLWNRDVNSDHNQRMGAPSILSYPLYRAVSSNQDTQGPQWATGASQALSQVPPPLQAWRSEDTTLGAGDSLPCAPPCPELLIMFLLPPSFPLPWRAQRQLEENAIKFKR